MKTLRGKTGADFEGEARVTRGNRSAFCSCFGEKGGEPNKQRYVLVKGTNLFIFAKETSPAPKYAVDIPHKKIVLREKVGHSQIVTIETGLGDVEYKVKFDLRANEHVAKNFALALKEEAAVGETNEIKEKLGHRSAFKASKSIMYADTVAAQKRKNQPDAPLTMGEAMINVPTMPDFVY